MNAAMECPIGDSTRSILSFHDQDPFPYYEALRARGPVLWDDGLQGWIILSFELCKFVETREDLFRTSYADATAVTREVKGGDTIAILTGEKHRKARLFHLKLLSAGAVDTFRREHVQPVIRWLIDRFADRGSAELVSELANQVPTRMIASMFGMDWQSDVLVRRIHADHDRIVDWIGRRNPENTYLERALAGSHDLNELLMPYIRARKDGDASDLVSHIWREAAGHYGDLDEVDVLAICRELLFAGADTTIQALTNALYLLLTDHEARIAVQRDPERLDNFVEEAFRLYPAAQWRFRLANENVELGGVIVKKDAVVISLKAASNRDPERFSRPADVDLARARPGDHLTFNTGPRTCAGARLARAEMREVVAAVLDRLANVRLDPTAEQPRLSGLYMQGFRPINVVFDRELNAENPA